MHKRGYEKAIKEAMVDIIRSMPETHSVERLAIREPVLCPPTHRVITRSQSKLALAGRNQSAEDKEGYNFDVIHQPKMRKMKARKVKKMKIHVRRSERLRARALNLP